MAINPNIALSFQAPKIDDPLNKLAQMEQIKAYRQNALAKQMEMDAAVREREMTNALRQRLASGKDFGLSEAAMFGEPGMKMYGAMAEARSKEQAEKTSRARYLNEKIKQYSGMLAGVSTPDEYAQVRSMATQDVPEFDKTWVSPDRWTPEWNNKTVAGTSAITKQLEMSYKRPFELEKEINDLVSNMYTPEGVIKPEVVQRVNELRGMLSEMTGGRPASVSPAAGLGAGGLEQQVIGGEQPTPPSPQVAPDMAVVGTEIPTGRVVPTVPEAEKPKTFREQILEARTAQERGKKQVALDIKLQEERPAAIASSQKAIQSLNEITKNLDALLGEKDPEGKAGVAASYKGHPGLEYVTGKIAGRPFAREITRSLTDEAADAAAIQDAIDAQKFTSSIAELKALSSSGSTGLGQLAVQEGNKIQTAFADLNAARGTEAYKQKLIDFRKKVEESKRLIADKINSVYGKDTVSFGANPAEQDESQSVSEMDDGWSVKLIKGDK